MLSPLSSQMSTRKAKCVLVFMDKSDSTRPGPPVFIPHAVAARRLSRLLRTLPAQPGRQAARWSRLAARDQTRRLPDAGAPRRGRRLVYKMKSACVTVVASPMPTRRIVPPTFQIERIIHPQENVVPLHSAAPSKYQIGKGRRGDTRQMHDRGGGKNRSSAPVCIDIERTAGGVGDV